MGVLPTTVSIFLCLRLPPRQLRGVGPLVERPNSQHLLGDAVVSGDVSIPQELLFLSLQDWLLDAYHVNDGLPYSFMLSCL